MVVIPLRKRRLVEHLGILALVALFGVSNASAQIVRTGENSKLPPGGDVPARGQKETDFPRVRKVADNVYLFEALHQSIKTLQNNSLIIITSDGVVVLEGHGGLETCQQIVEAVKKLTPQPIKYVVVGSEHGDHTSGLPGFPETTKFVGHAILKAEFELRAVTPGRGGAPPPKVVPITEIVGSLPADPMKAPPAVTKVLKVGDTELHIMFLGRTHSGPDLMTYLPRERILWLSEMFQPRIFPSEGDSAHPSEWAEVLKKVEQLPNVNYYLSAHGYQDSPAVMKEELLNFRRALEAVNAEAKRLFDLKVPVEETPKQWNFGPYATWYRYTENGLPDMRKNYLELAGKLAPCPPCR